MFNKTDLSGITFGIVVWDDEVSVNFCIAKDGDQISFYLSDVDAWAFMGKFKTTFGALDVALTKAVNDVNKNKKAVKEA
jgi:hypothetical protein